MNFFPHSAQTAIEPGVLFSYLPFLGAPSGFPANMNSSFFCFFKAASLFAEFFLFEAAADDEPDPDATAFAFVVAEEVDAIGDSLGSSVLVVVRVTGVEVESSGCSSEVVEGGVAVVPELGCRTLPEKFAPGPVIPCSCTLAPVVSTDQRAERGGRESVLGGKKLKRNEDRKLHLLDWSSLRCYYYDDGEAWREGEGVSGEKREREEES